MELVRVLLAVTCVSVAVTRGKVVMEPELAELAAMLRDSCAADTGVDLALVERINDGEDLVPDAALKCYIKCVMETAGMFSEGHMDVEAVVAMLPPDFAAKNADTIRGCGTRTGADDCDTNYLTQVCWQNGNKADYFLI